MKPTFNTVVVGLLVLIAWQLNSIDNRLSKANNHLTPIWDVVADTQSRYDAAFEQLELIRIELEEM